jgi:hypothetical protein
VLPIKALLVRGIETVLPMKALSGQGNPSQSTGAGITNTGGVYSAKHERFWSPRNCQHSTHFSKAEGQSDRLSPVGAGATGRSDIKGEFNSQKVASTLWSFATVG